MQDLPEKDNAAKKSLKNLAKILNIPSRGKWLSILAEKIQINRDFIYNWRNRGDIPEDWVDYIVDQIDVPKDEWYIPRKTDTVSLDTETIKKVNRIIENGDTVLLGRLIGYIDACYSEVERVKKTIKKSSM